MSAKETQIENEAKEIKASDQICEKLGINALNPIDFSNEEYFEDLKKCGKRDIKSIINSYNKFIAHHIDILGYLRESFTKIESDEKHEIENAKLIKSLKKIKKFPNLMKIQILKKMMRNLPKSPLSRSLRSAMILSKILWYLKDMTSLMNGLLFKFAVL